MPKLTFGPLIELTPADSVKLKEASGANVPLPSWAAAAQSEYSLEGGSSAVLLAFPYGGYEPGTVFLQSANKVVFPSRSARPDRRRIAFAFRLLDSAIEILSDAGGFGEAAIKGYLASPEEYPEIKSRTSQINSGWVRISLIGPSAAFRSAQAIGLDPEGFGVLESLPDAFTTRPGRQAVESSVSETEISTVEAAPVPTPELEPAVV